MSAWHVASTRPHYESRVVRELLEMGFQAVWPRCLDLVKPKRRDVPRRAPLGQRVEIVSAFPNYVIFSPGPPWQTAREADGLTTVLRLSNDRLRAAVLPRDVVAWLCGPAGDGVIPDLIDAVKGIAVGMREFLKDERVRVVSGLVSVDGAVISSTHARTALLTAAGLKMIVPTRTVRAIEPELAMA